MARIHLILQGKGGVGKSYVAFLLAQYFQDNNCPTLLIDTDPVNSSFSSVKSLGVEHYDITVDQDIDQRTYDGLFQKASEADDQFEVVIDNGSSGYLSLVSYLITNDVIPHLHELGHEVIIHTILVGGRDLADTFSKFKEMALQLPSVKMAVWLNHQIAGDVERNGKPFVETKSFFEFKDRIVSVIGLPKRKESLFVKDIEDLLCANQTFDEGCNNPAFTMWSRNRLKIIKNETWAAIGASGLLVAPTEKEASDA